MTSGIQRLPCGRRVIGVAGRRELRIPPAANDNVDDEGGAHDQPGQDACDQELRDRHLHDAEAARDGGENHRQIDGGISISTPPIAMIGPTVMVG